MIRPLLVALLWFTALALPALAAVSKDGEKATVDPCLERPSACAAGAPQQAEAAVTEPMVIFLDAEGNTLVRLPLSRFRKEVPDAILPPELSGKR